MEERAASVRLQAALPTPSVPYRTGQSYGAVTGVRERSVRPVRARRRRDTPRRQHLAQRQRALGVGARSPTNHSQCRGVSWLLRLQPSIHTFRASSSRRRITPRACTPPRCRNPLSWRDRSERTCSARSGFPSSSRRGRVVSAGTPRSPPPLITASSQVKSEPNRSSRGQQRLTARHPTGPARQPDGGPPIACSRPLSKSKPGILPAFQMSFSGRCRGAQPHRTHTISPSLRGSRSSPLASLPLLLLPPRFKQHPKRQQQQPPPPPDLPERPLGFPLH